MSNAKNEFRVAMYWDFENIHAAHFDLHNGEGAYHRVSNRNQQQDPLFEVEVVTSFAATIGAVVINRAYANWQNFAKYRNGLLKHAIDLVQLYPTGSHGKNGEDIRMSLDVLEDVYRFPHITHILLVSGDSDFIPLVHKIQQLDKYVIGIGVERATNNYFTSACNEFKFFKTLQAMRDDSAPVTAPAPASNDPRTEDLTDTGDIEDARALLLEAMKREGAEGDNWVVRAAIKPLMQRLRSTFDESDFGYKSFTAFLKACDDMVEMRQGQHDYECRLKSGSLAPAPTPVASAVPMASSELIVARQYEDILKEQGMRLPVSVSLRQGVRLAAGLFKDAAVPYKGFRALDGELAVSMASLGSPEPSRAEVEARMSDARKVRIMLYNARQFNLKGDIGPSLKTTDPALLTRAVVSAILFCLRRVIDLQDELDLTVLDSLLTREGEQSIREVIVEERDRFVRPEEDAAQP